MSMDGSTEVWIVQHAMSIDWSAHMHALYIYI